MGALLWGAFFYVAVCKGWVIFFWKALDFLTAEKGEAKFPQSFCF